MYLRNNKYALENPDFVLNEINELLSKGCILEVANRPSIINPLTVAYNNVNKPRLDLDCRHINNHLFKFKYKYEDSEVARDIFETGDFVFTYDLKSAYHHLPLFHDHRDYLGFSWTWEGKTIFFVYNVLPVANQFFMITGIIQAFLGLRKVKLDFLSITFCQLFWQPQGLFFPRSQGILSSSLSPKRSKLSCI